MNVGRMVYSRGTIDRPLYCGRQVDPARSMNAHLLFFAGKAYPLLNETVGGATGGAELKLVQFARMLAATTRHRVSFACTAPDWVTESHGGLTVHGLAGIGGSRHAPELLLRGPLCLWRRLKILRSVRADIYVQTCAGLDTALVAAAAGLERRRFVYWAACDGDFDGRLERELGAFGWLFRSGLRRSDLIICQNENQMQAVARRFGLPALLIRNGIQTTKRVSITDRKGLLWVGHWTSIKQPELYVELARRMPDVPLTLIASSEPTDRAGREMVDRARRELSNLRVLFNIPHNALAPYFAEARALVNTSRVEGFPNTFLLAGRVGTPLATLAADPDGIIRELGLGTSAGGDVDLLSRGVRALIENDLLWERSSRNVHDYVCRNHDLTTESQKLAVALEALVASR